MNSQLHLFLDVSSARRQVSNPFIWFRNHNDVISIKMHSCVSQNQPRARPANMWSKSKVGGLGKSFSVLVLLD